ncbi:hypothetical protein F4780DRAFT_452037 [Xylariomycetidae sp. FL0641]|nr:hypothetical protein F4780DRAFT_452037 [Xylariomycetidae sp. FL0641]
MVAGRDRLGFLLLELIIGRLSIRCEGSQDDGRWRMSGFAGGQRDIGGVCLVILRTGVQCLQCFSVPRYGIKPEQNPHCRQATLSLSGSRRLPSLRVPPTTSVQVSSRWVSREPP